MKKVLSDICGFSFVIILLLLIVGIPLIAFLCISRIKYTSIWALLFFILKISLLDIIAESLAKIVIEGFTLGLSLKQKHQTLLRYSLDFFLSLMVVHFVDEWSTNVTLSSMGEILFTLLIILFTYILEKQSDEKNEA